MSIFRQHRLFQFFAFVAVLWLQSAHGFVVSPIRSRTVSDTVRFVKQPTSFEEALISKQKNNEIQVSDKDEEDEAYKRKMAISFFLADTSMFGFVLLAVVALSGAVLNACGYGYMILPDGTMVIDTLEHFQMQIWSDAVPSLTSQTALYH